MKKLIALVLALVCVLGLVGCNTTQNDIDKVSEAENSPNVSGNKLSEGSVTFEVNPKIEGAQIADISIQTNTTMIRVTAANIAGDTEIPLFLYDAENPDNPILYATLTAKDNSVDFTNLTSACAYKIGAEINNSDQSVTLTITD